MVLYLNEHRTRLSPAAKLLLEQHQNNKDAWPMQLKAGSYFFHQVHLLFLYFKKGLHLFGNQ